MPAAAGFANSGNFLSLSPSSILYFCFLQNCSHRRRRHEGFFFF
jgi:hypothetical protein